MYPTEKVSSVQEVQMTTVTNENGVYPVFRYSSCASYWTSNRLMDTGFELN